MPIRRRCLPPRRALLFRRWCRYYRRLTSLRRLLYFVEAIHYLDVLSVIVGAASPMLFFATTLFSRFWWWCRLHELSPAIEHYVFAVYCFHIRRHGISLTLWRRRRHTHYRRHWLHSFGYDIATARLLVSSIEDIFAALHRYDTDAAAILPLASARFLRQRYSFYICCYIAAMLLSRYHAAAAIVKLRCLLYASCFTLLRFGATRCRCGFRHAALYAAAKSVFAFYAARHYALQQRSALLLLLLQRASVAAFSPRLALRAAICCCALPLALLALRYVCHTLKWIK